MRRPFRVPIFLFAWLVVLAVALPAGAQNPQRQSRSAGPANGNASTAQASASGEHRQTEQTLPRESVTTHTIRVRGREIGYTARAGALPLTDDSGKQTAEVFYVAYTVSGGDPARRPITFAFNGGPGASSAYLHLGALGPLAVDFGDGRTPPGDRTGHLVDNPDTWLPFTDLVFIDPVGTGYSRAASDVKDVAQEFWGMRQDLDALGQTIRRALTHLDRLSSPVYLAGESYGGFRAARLVEQLPTDQGIKVSGAVLVSPVLEFSLQSGSEFHPLASALHLPSYAAVNLDLQGKLTPEALSTAERFAMTDYLETLTAPANDARRSPDFYAKIAALTGLDENVVARWGGRVPTGVFVKEIRHGKSEVASSYDAAVLASDPYPFAPSRRGNDPVFEGVIAPLTTAFLNYVRNDLHYRTDRRYRVLNGDVARKWQWGGNRRGPSGSIGASDQLRQALSLNPRLKIEIDHGMTDLVTPYMASRYVVEHLPPDLIKGRVTVNLYSGGHMMYLRPESRAAMRNNAQALYGGE